MKYLVNEQIFIWVIESQFHNAEFLKLILNDPFIKSTT